MPDPQDLKTEFEKYANDQVTYAWDAERKEFWQYSDLTANWDAVGERWWLQCGSTKKGIFDPPQECLGALKDLAGRAAVSTGLCAADHPEPWRVWLDALRHRGWWRGCGFSVTHIHYTEQGSRKELPPRRREDPGPAEVELERFLDVLEARAKVSLTDSERARLSVLEKAFTAEQEQRRQRTLEDNEKLLDTYRFVESGSIDQVFRTSARLLWLILDGRYRCSTTTRA